MNRVFNIRSAQRVRLNFFFFFLNGYPVLDIFYSYILIQNRFLFSRNVLKSHPDYNIIRRMVTVHRAVQTRMEIHGYRTIRFSLLRVCVESSDGRREIIVYTHMYIYIVIAREGYDADGHFCP